MERREAETAGAHTLRRWRTALAVPLFAWACSLGAAQQLVELSDAALDAAELFDKVAPSIWVVTTNDASGKPMSSGSSVVVAAETLVTNCHVLKDAGRVSVRRGATELAAQQAEADPEHDLCLLRVSGIRAPKVLLAPEDSLRPGMRVYAVGAPRRLEQTISDGLLSALRRDASGGLAMVQTSAPISPGSSGGGLFDAHGRLIGITTSALKDSQNLNFAMPARWVEALSRRAGRPEWQARIATPEFLERLRPSQVSKPAEPVGSNVAPAAPATPAPPVTSTARTAAPEIAPSPAPSTTLAPGAPWSEIEYTLRDRFTGNSRTVVYRLDAGSKDVLSFNNGGRVEKPNGEVVAVRSPIAGEFEGSMPPGGWVRLLDLREGREWSADYALQSSAGLTIKMRLNASANETETLVIAGQERRLLRIDYRGYMQRSGTSAGLAAHANGAYRASAWWSPELARVVRFSVRSSGGIGGAAFAIDEDIELTAIR